MTHLPTARGLGFSHFNATDLQDINSQEAIRKLAERASELTRQSGLPMVLFIEDELYHQLCQWVDSADEDIPGELKSQISQARITLNSLSKPETILFHAGDFIPFAETIKRNQTERFHGRFYEFAAGKRKPLGYTGPKFVRDILALSHPDLPVLNLDQDVIEDAKDPERVAFLATKIVEKAIENLSKPFAVSGTYTDERVYDSSSIRTLQFMQLSDAESVRNNNDNANNEEEFSVFQELKRAENVSKTLKRVLQEMIPFVPGQLLSGAGFTPNALFLRQYPEFSNLRGLAIWCDDHWIEAVRQGQLSETAGADLNIRFEQERHPNGVEYKDIQWHSQSYLIRFLFGIAGLNILTEPTIIHAIQNGDSNSPALRSALWKTARAALVESISDKKRQLFKDTIFDAAIDGGQKAKELELLNQSVYPNGLGDAINTLPSDFPTENAEEKAFAKELRMLVEDIAVWATEMREWWQDCFIPAAERFPRIAQRMTN